MEMNTHSHRTGTSYCAKIHVSNTHYFFTMRCIRESLSSFKQQVCSYLQNIQQSKAMVTESSTATQSVLPVVTDIRSCSNYRTSSININDNTSSIVTTGTATTMATEYAPTNNPSLPSSSSLIILDSVMENMDILQVIVDFVGPKQYLFVATINRIFHEVHTKVFPNNFTTYPNASSLEIAKNCFDDLVDTSCNTKKLQWMLCSSAAKSGNLPALQYLRSIECEWNEATCSNAALYGHYEMLKWARENGCDWERETCSNAALNGHLDILQYVREKGCPWDELTCSKSAENGDLHILQRARENECPWDEWTCTRAAANGHLHVLQWARQNGCRWDLETCASAAENGNLHILQWSRENDCPWDAWTCT